MIYIVALLAILICVASIVGIFKTSLFIDLVHNLVITRPLRVAAIVARILLGIILIIAAPETRFPLTIVILGGLVILSGIVLIFTDEAKIQSWIDVWLRQSLLILRTIFLVAALFGLFLLYAVVQ